MKAVTAFSEGVDFEEVTGEPVYFSDCIKKRK